MAPHSSTLAWKIPWTEEPGGLQSMGSLQVRHDWTTSLSLSSIGEGNGNPLQNSCLENPGDGGAWWAAVYGVAQSRTRLKWLSSSRDYMYSDLGSIKSTWFYSQMDLVYRLSRISHYWEHFKNQITCYYTAVYLPTTLHNSKNIIIILSAKI